MCAAEKKMAADEKIRWPLNQFAKPVNKAEFDLKKNFVKKKAPLMIWSRNVLCDCLPKQNIDRVPIMGYFMTKIRDWDALRHGGISL